MSSACEQLHNNATCMLQGALEQMRALDLAREPKEVYVPPEESLLDRLVSASAPWPLAVSPCALPHGRATQPATRCCATPPFSPALWASI